MKSRFIAFDESSLMLHAVGQLKSRAWQARPVYAVVQLRSDPGSLVTSRSISGAATHPSPLIRDSLLMPPRRSRRSCSSSSGCAITRCRPSAGSSMTSTRCLRSCRCPRATSPRRTTRARGARARAHDGRSRQWGVVLSVLLLDVVLLQCGSQGLSSKSIVSGLTFSHELHVRYDSQSHRHL